jgi:hypothetical protein
MRKNIRRTSDNYLIDAFFELLWGIEIALICVVIDYFVILNILDKWYVSCDSITNCPQSMGYNILYLVSKLMWAFAVIYPLTKFIIALVKGYRNNK